jgi:hypothetical protein
MYPFKGMFRGKVVGFAAKEGQKPAPKVNQSQYGDYLSFTVLIEITYGEKGTVGAIVPYSLRYNFDADKDGLVEFTKWGNNSVHTPRLAEFLSLAGAWEAGEMKASENILPKLEKRILKANKELIFQIKGGWIVSESLDVEGAESDDDDPMWDDDYAVDVEDDEPSFEPNSDTDKNFG